MTKTGTGPLETFQMNTQLARWNSKCKNVIDAQVLTL